MTELTPFDLARFEQLLDVYGAELGRWPEELRPRLSELLASSGDAQLAWSRAARLAALLDAAPDLLPSAELSARIAALPVRHRQGWAAWWPFGNPLAPLFAWGAAAAFGLLIGSGIVPGLESIADVASSSSAGEPVPPARDSSEAAAQQRSDSLVEDSGGRDAVATGAAGDASGGDEAQPDDWSDLELALGLAPEWEEEQ